MSAYCIILVFALSVSAQINVDTVAQNHGQLMATGSLPAASTSALHTSDETPYFTVNRAMAKVAGASISNPTTNSTFNMNAQAPVGQTARFIQYLPSGLTKKYSNIQNLITMRYPNGELVPDSVIQITNQRLLSGLRPEGPGIDSHPNAYLPNGTPLYATREELQSTLVRNNQQSTFALPQLKPELDKYGSIVETAIQFLGKLATGAIGQLVGGLSGLKESNKNLTKDYVAADALHALTAGTKTALGLPFPVPKTARNQAVLRLVVRYSCVGGFVGSDVQPDTASSSATINAQRIDTNQIRITPNIPGQKFLISDQLVVQGTFYFTKDNKTAINYPLQFADSFVKPTQVQVVQLLNDGAILQFSAEPENQVDFDFGPGTVFGEVPCSNVDYTYFIPLTISWSSTQELPFF